MCESMEISNFGTLLVFLLYRSIPRRSKNDLAPIMLYVTK